MCERKLYLLAGTMVLVSLTLNWLVSPYWLFLALFVALNQIQFSFTGFCPANLIFRALNICQPAKAAS